MFTNSLILPSQAGVVSVVHLPDDATLALVTVNVNGAAFASDTVIVTNTSLQQTTNHQITRSLGQVSYLYSFGDNPGVQTVSGMCFTAACGGGLNYGTGLDQFLAFYNANKASQFNINNGIASVPLVTVVVGSTPFSGILVESNVMIDDAQARISKFSLKLILLV